MAFKAAKKPMILEMTSPYGDFNVSCEMLSQSALNEFLNTPDITRSDLLAKVLISTSGLSTLDDVPIASDDKESALALFDELPDLTNGVYDAYFRRLSPAGSNVKAKPAGSGRAMGTPKRVN